MDLKNALENTKTDKTRKWTWNLKIGLDKTKDLFMRILKRYDSTGLVPIVFPQNEKQICPIKLKAHLSFNEIHKIDASFEHFPNIRSLYLHGNQIK